MPIDFEKALKTYCPNLRAQKKEEDRITGLHIVHRGVMVNFCSGEGPGTSLQASCSYLQDVVFDGEYQTCKRVSKDMPTCPLREMELSE
jgi:hypothetical protein